jgi:hypothetical protein
MGPLDDIGVKGESQLVVPSARQGAQGSTDVRSARRTAWYWLGLLAACAALAALAVRL